MDRAGEVGATARSHERARPHVDGMVRTESETNVMHYFKATRPDGTDFATGTTRPVMGEWMPRIEGRIELCKRGYHVSDAPAETLIGGSWPCRLFEVEIAEDVPAEYIDGHKRVVHTYRPIRELPAWQALGPNGESVAALIDRARTLTPEEAERVNAARVAAGTAAVNAAWDSAGTAARVAAGTAAVNAAWYAAWYAAGTWEAAVTAAWDAALGAAWDAARDAVLALVVRDLITPEQFETLYGPWASVMEEV